MTRAPKRPRTVRWQGGSTPDLRRPEPARYQTRHRLRLQFAPIRSVASPVIDPVYCSPVEADRPRMWRRRELNPRPNELTLLSYPPLPTTPNYTPRRAASGAK